MTAKELEQDGGNSHVFSQIYLKNLNWLSTRALL